MQRIALLSDTHGYLDPAVFKYLDKCDQIWHAGDIGSIGICEKLKSIKPLTAVYGNIDGTDIRKQYPKDQRFSCEKVRVWMTHIAGYPGKYDAGIVEVLQASPPKLFICGHTHILRVMFDKKYNMLYMNPGAAGKYGFHKVKTLLRFSIEEEEIKDLQVIELGPRIS